MKQVSFFTHHASLTNIACTMGVWALRASESQSSAYFSQVSIENSSGSPNMIGGQPAAFNSVFETKFGDVLLDKTRRNNKK
jgi:hypothetical protein